MTQIKLEEKLDDIKSELCDISNRIQKITDDVSNSLVHKNQFFSRVSKIANSVNDLFSKIVTDAHTGEFSLQKFKDAESGLLFHVIQRQNQIILAINEFKNADESKLGPWAQEMEECANLINNLNQSYIKILKFIESNK